jgi:pimeloyl-ACP methyl ester carboxylesterase
MIYALPGAGADSRMYQGAWRGLAESVFLDWPEYHGESSISSIAQRVANESKIADGDILIGSSLGGIVACEIASIRDIRILFLLGSAKSREEISPVLSLLHPLVDLAPMEFIQRAAGKLPNDVSQMFSEGQAPFIRAMCKAIFDWGGMNGSLARPIRIHGRFDRVVPLPVDVDLVLPCGHLVAMTHAQECVSFITGKLAQSDG